MALATEGANTVTFRTIIKSLLAAALLLTGARLTAAGYTAYKMASPPTLDGRADDPAWQKIPWAYGFRDLYQKYSYSPRQTAFKIAYDRDFLYLLIRCCEPEMTKVKTGARAQDGWPTSLDDLYFISANAYVENGTWEDSPFTIMQIGAGQIQRAHRHGEGVVADPPGWKTAYQADDRNWYIETAIPLSFLALDPAKGGFFNIVRHLTTIPGGRLQWTSSWNPVDNSKLDQHTFCPLNFSPESGVTDVAAAEYELVAHGDGNYGWWLGGGGKLGKIAARGGEYAEAMSRLSNSPNWPLAEEVRGKIAAVMKQYPANGAGIGAKTDAYLDWQYTLLRMTDTSAPVRLELRMRDATVQVFLNGQEIKPVAGIFAFSLTDDPNALAVAAKAAGPNPGLEIKLPDFPETDGRWVAESAPADGWRQADFDDLKWSRPTADGIWLWSKPGADKACFRQLLLWSRNIYSGKLAALVPPHTEYGFSPDTVEVLQHTIFSPLGRSMTSYVLQVELPAGFRLLEGKASRNLPQARPPQEMASRDIAVDGRPYRQYTLKYNVAKLVEADTALLPVKQEKGGTPGSRTVFRFRRLINDNITALTSILPVSIQPPVNGRCMKTIQFPQYDHQAGWSIADDVLTELVRQGVAAGMDLWFVNPRLAGANRIIRDNGGRQGVWGNNLPLWGPDKSNTAMYKLLKENPQYRVTYFNNTGNRFPGDDPYALDFCPTYSLGEGREAFAAALLADYRNWKDSVPEAGLRFLNNENYPWGHTGDDTAHRYCFCDRCKMEFRKFAGLSADLPLADQAIWEKFRDPWAKFWKQNQSGRLMDLVQTTAATVGFKTIFYHNTGDKDTWRAVTGKPDLYCVGFPGCMHYAGRDQQLELDETMKFFASIGIPRLIGQRSTYFPFRSGKDGRYRSVGSKDGWALNPKHVKLEIVRMAATVHGGVLYESVMQLSGGSLYYFGEATRLIAAHEDLFHNGKREDALAEAGDCKYPDILVLTQGDERLVLVFNETATARTLRLVNRNLKPGQQAEVFEKPGKIVDPAAMEITVPPEDVTAIYVK